MIEGNVVYMFSKTIYKAIKMYWFGNKKNIKYQKTKHKLFLFYSVCFLHVYYSL